MRRPSGIGLTLILFALIAIPVGALDDYVVAEVWTELDPFISNVRPVPRDVATERLLGEAQYVISGMVYGYSFDYVPGDPTRDIPESFSMEPRAFIEWGDPALTVLQTWVDGDRLVARVGYELSQGQSLWFSGWHSSANPDSVGTGAASLFLGQEARTDAIADGVRSAVREYVRRREFTRPQRITGAGLLASSPTLSIYQGNYQARVHVLLQIDEIDRFSTF